MIEFLFGYRYIIREFADGMYRAEAKCGPFGFWLDIDGRTMHYPVAESAIEKHKEMVRRERNKNKTVKVHKVNGKE